MPYGNSARQLLFNGGDIACGAVVSLLEGSLAHVRGSDDVNLGAHMVEGQQAVEEHESSIGNLQVRFGERGDGLELPHSIVGKESDRARDKRRQAWEGSRHMVAQQLA